MFADGRVQIKELPADLKHVLSEVLPSVPLLLPQLAEDEVTEVREVDESVPANDKVLYVMVMIFLLCNIVCNVHDLLVSGVETQPGESAVEILGEYRALSQSCLQGLEHGRHVIQLLPGELVRVVRHELVDLHRSGEGDVVEDESLVLGLEIVGHGVVDEKLRLEV